MKIKFIAIIVLLAVLYISCSREDDASTTNSTQTTKDLFGTWDLDYYIENGTLVEEILCSQQITYVFSKDGRYTKTTYAGEGSSNCTLAVIVNGTWSTISENQYALVPNGSGVEENLNITSQDNFSKFSVVYSGSYTEVYTKQ
jgi:hypothetical protein